MAWLIRYQRNIPRWIWAHAFLFGEKHEIRRRIASIININLSISRAILSAYENRITTALTWISEFRSERSCKVGNINRGRSPSSKPAIPITAHALTRSRLIKSSPFVQFFRARTSRGVRDGLAGHVPDSSEIRINVARVDPQFPLASTWQHPPPPPAPPASFPVLIRFSRVNGERFARVSLTAHPSGQVFFTTSGT